MHLILLKRKFYFYYDFSFLSFDFSEAIKILMYLCFLVDYFFLLQRILYSIGSRIIKQQNLLLYNIELKISLFFLHRIWCSYVWSLSFRTKKISNFGYDDPLYIFLAVIWSNHCIDIILKIIFSCSIENKNNLFKFFSRLLINQ